MFSKTQLDRYSRHIILKGVGAEGQQKLLNSKVAVIGAGGLGSPVLLYLAAAGVGTLGIIDFDKVELSNLQRQIIHGTQNVGNSKTASAQDALSNINPEVALELHNTQLNSSNALAILKNYDLIIDGSDSFATRYLVNDACVLLKKPLIYGALSQFEGQVSLFNGKNPTSEALNESLCYRCLFPNPPKVGSVPSCSEAGVFGALAGVIGSLMAVEAIKYLIGLGESLAGTLLHYDALYAETRRINLKRDKDCAICGDTPSIHELIDYELFCA